MPYVNDRDDRPSGNMPDEFDRLLGGLDGLPDVTSTKPSPIRTITPLVGNSQLWSVQTYRQRERGDTIFLECSSKDGHIRLAIPPQVSDAIARQRDALTGRVRSKIGKASAQARKDRGELPGFMRGKKKGTK
jgi:hypothetical protein